MNDGNKDGPTHFKNKWWKIDTNYTHDKVLFTAIVEKKKV